MDKATTPQSDIGYYTFEENRPSVEQPGLDEESTPVSSHAHSNNVVEYQHLSSTPASHWQVVYTDSLPIQSSISALTLSSVAGEAVGGSSLEIDEDLQTSISADEINSVERERSNKTGERTEISPLLEAALVEPSSAATRETAHAVAGGEAVRDEMVATHSTHNTFGGHPGVLSRSYQSLAPRSSIANAGRMLSSFDSRWVTFTHIPPTEADRLACQAGFYQTSPDLDILCCHSCRCLLRRNSLPSDVWLLHARLSPSCTFVLNTRGSEYVDDCKGELTHLQRCALVHQAGEITSTFPNDELQDMHWNYTMGSYRVDIGGNYLPSAQFYPSDLRYNLAEQVQELVAERQASRQRQEEMQRELTEMRAEVQMLRARLDETEDRSLTNESRGLANSSRVVAHGNVIYNQSIELRQQRSKVDEHEYQIQGSSQQVEELSDSLSGMCDTVRAHDEHINNLRRARNVMATTQLGIQARCLEHSTAINDLDRRSTANTNTTRAVQRQAMVNAAAIDHVEGEVSGVRTQARDDDSDEDVFE